MLSVSEGEKALRGMSFPLPIISAQLLVLGGYRGSDVFLPGICLPVEETQKANGAPELGRGRYPPSKGVNRFSCTGLGLFGTVVSMSVYSGACLWVCLFTCFIGGY